jgi:hypothetical protein
MGLDLLVGVRALISDPEDAAEFEADIAPVNEALALAGLPTHSEPAAAQDDVFSCQMFGYRGLHDLRRLAVHLAVGDEPEPIKRHGQSAEDSLLRSVYENWPIDPRDDGISFLNETLEPGPFDHLLYHSDADGFYVPIDFPRVIVRAMGESAEDLVIGSSVALARECRRIAAWLGIPDGLGFDDEQFWRAADDPPTIGPRWKQFGIESFGCRRLLDAADHSVERGMLLLFT